MHARLFGPVLLALVMLLTGCASAANAGAAQPGSGSQTTPSPTDVTVKMPETHTLSLGTAQADLVFPGPHGLAFFAAKQTDSALVEDRTSLSYYDFTTQQVSTIATAANAPDGTPRTIADVAAAGDWVFFVQTDETGAHWSLDAVNVVTHQQKPVDSYVQEQSSANTTWLGRMISDGAQLVWSTSVQSDAGMTFVLRSYDLASGQTQALLSGPRTPAVAPLAVFHGSVLLFERHPQPDDTDGLYLWKSGDLAPQQISTFVPLNAALNDQYAVWDDPHTMNLTLYNRSTGEITPDWETGCLRPALAPDRPYVVCLDFNHSALKLLQVPSDKGISFASANTGQRGAIANGRAYWVFPTPGSPFSTTIDYIDLPQS